jgi:hypothetical protein
MHPTIELPLQNLWSRRFKEIRVDRILEAFYSHTFYILGAGASYHLVPTIAQIADKILPYAARFHGFPAGGMRNNITFQRIINEDTLPSSRIRTPVEVLVKGGNLAPATLHGLWRRELAPRNLSIPIPHYEVFQLARRRSILFLLNVDGIGRRCCRQRHFAIEAHGSDPPEELHSKWSEELIDRNIYEFDPWQFLHGALPIGPEPVGIAQTAPYRRAFDLFRTAKNLVLVGYSFGRRKDGGIDDNQTFDFFVNLLREYPKPHLVVDKEPTSIAGEIQDAASLRDVYAIQAEWNHLSQAILNVAHRRGCYDPLRLLGSCSEIQREYFGLLERSPD